MYETPKNNLGCNACFHRALQPNCRIMLRYVLSLDGSLRHYNSRLIFRYLLHNSQHILNIFLLESLVTAIFGLFNLYRGLGHSNLML